MDSLQINTSQSSWDTGTNEGAHAELWRSVVRLAGSEQERIVLIDAFVYGLTPDAILARHPRLFADIRAVYATKRDLLVRFQHDYAAQELLQV